MTPGGGGGGGTPYSRLYGEALPKRGAFFKLTVRKRVGKLKLLQSGRNGG